MKIYLNGDSHTAAAEALNSFCFAEDDPQLAHMGRLPHPDNFAVSWGKLLADQLGAELYCDAESASSNDRIMRTTKQYLKLNSNPNLMIIQWSTWEREEWLIDGTHYQVNASGIDIVPETYQQKYKEYIAGIKWQEKTEQAHLKIWNYHLWLKSRKIKHVFFNGNNNFSKISNKQDWGVNYINPYDPAGTYDSILNNKYDTVSPASYHYGADAHRYWANYILRYLVDNKLV